MMMHLSNMAYFVDDHLNDEALAFAAEALNKNKLDSLPRSVKDHIENCQLCRKEIYAISEASRFIRSDNHTGRIIEMSAKNTVPERRKLLYIVGTAAAILILGGLLAFMKNTPPKDQALLTRVTDEQIVPVVSIPDTNRSTAISESKKAVSSRKSETKQQALHISDLKGEAYNESAFFENISQSAYRGSSDVNLKPKNGTIFTVNQPVVFDFDSVSKGPVSLLLFDNTGKNIFKVTDITEQNYMLNTPLTAGLYYWKLENSADLLYLGKFFVAKQ